MAQQTLNAGSPPIVWSTVEDAFTKINANFDELYGSIGGPGGVIDFTSLSTSIIPSASEVFDLGSPTFRWRDLYLAGSSLYLGSAQITANGAGVVNLPLGTTVNGQLIINPTNTAFKTFSVAGQSDIVADSVIDTFTVASGTGIALTTNASTDTLTIANSGVTGLAGTVGQIGVSAATGSVTLTNLGVTSLTGTAGGIGVSAATGGVTLTNLGVKQIVGTASQIGVSGDGTGIVTITNLAPASPTFRFIVVDGATLQPVAADNISDTLNLISGAGLTITKDTTTDTLTFSVNSTLDIKGSVFGGDSSLIVDGTSGNITGQSITAATGFQGNLTGILKGSVFADDSSQIIDGNTFTVYGNIEATTLRTAETEIALGLSAGEISQGPQAVAVGYGAGYSTQGTAAVAVGDNAGSYTQGNYAVAIGVNAGASTQGTNAVAIGPGAGASTQGNDAVAIGVYAGQNLQGASAVAIGYQAGFSSQTANSIVINASGVALNGVAAGFYVKPIRSLAAGRIAVYETSGFEVGYTNLEINGSTLSTNDSSGMVVDVLTTFQSDVVVESDLTVAERLTVKGSRVINLTELKSVVAASADFTDFQTRIAALV